MSVCACAFVCGGPLVHGKYLVVVSLATVMMLHVNIAHVWRRIKFYYRPTHSPLHTYKHTRRHSHTHTHTRRDKYMTSRSETEFHIHQQSNEFNAK